MTSQAASPGGYRVFISRFDREMRSGIRSGKRHSGATPRAPAGPRHPRCHEAWSCRGCAVQWDLIAIMGKLLDNFGWGTAITVLAAVAALGTASADPATTGRKPSGQGDIVQFEIEWKADAARGSIEAQFRLGELYEQLRGNYLEAESWYARAAERGSIQALYRLALIALAGSGDVAPDPVTAYKWAVLASDPNDQWGRLAEDLRSQLEAVLTAAERGDAKKQAELWRQQRTGQSTALARTAPEQGEATGPSRAATAPDRTPDPVPVRPARRTARNALPRRHMRGHRPGRRRSWSLCRHPRRAVRRKRMTKRCSSRRCGACSAAPCEKRRTSKGKPVITGTVSDDAGRLNLIRVSSALAPEYRPEIQVRVVSLPLCRSLSELDGFRTASLVAEDLQARLTGPGATA